MRIREITIQNLRLLKDVHIPFERDGSPRLWTVFIGRNGTGKTSILQAIALAAAGNAGALSLAGDKVREQLPDLRTKQEAVIRAKFEFGELGQKYGEKPLLGATSSPTGVRVQLRVPPGRDPLRSVSWYTTSEGEGVAPEAPATEETDPLVKARTASLNHWFVAGYGMQRNVEDRKPGSVRPSWPSIDRLRPLFEPTSLVGPNFMDILPDDSLKREFAKTLKQIITGSTGGMLPGITDIELRGAGGVTTGRDLWERNRILETIGADTLKLPATWLAHGHQSTFAWIADLVGQILLEAGSAVSPKDVEGLVLVDEIDLYLHPTWQVLFVRALREAFPKLQFIATTHSPILLTGLHREEVIMLDRDESTGNIHWRHPDRDPRLLTGSELYEEFFEIRDLYPTDLARKLDDYRSLAMNPKRLEEDEVTVTRLLKELRAEGIAVRDPIPREGGSEAAE
jgi:hypothetical protein